MLQQAIHSKRRKTTPLAQLSKLIQELT